MSEQQAEYGVAKSDIGTLQTMSAVTWERNALVFNTGLVQQTIDQIAGGLTKFSEGYQLYFGDFWKMLEASGYEWADYVPDIAYNTAVNWLRMAKRFPVRARLRHRHVKASHYIEANNKKLSDDQANELIDRADAYEWTVQMVREAVRVAIGKPERQEKPKVIVCQHCDKPIVEIEDEACPWCMLSVSDTRVEALRAVLTEIANPSGGLDSAELANRALLEV